MSTLKENFSLRHRGASGLRRIENSSWSILYLIMSQTGIHWSVENNETDGVKQSARDTRAVNKLAMNAGIIIV